MKTKNYILFLLTGLLLFACDTISQEERWLPIVEQSQEVNPILIEEYTGQKCINCPKAGAELHEIVEQSGVAHIIVAMHSPHSGLTLEGLASSEAKEYANAFSLPRSIPGIMLNRQKLNAEGYYSQDRSQWAGLIQQVSARPCPYKLSLKAEYLPKQKEIQVSLSSELLGKAKSNVSLQLWLVEDIVDGQLTKSGYKKKYQHHNVFRSALNGLWGESYLVAKDYKQSFPLPASVKDVKQTKLVAFLFDTKTKAILISRMASIIENK